MSDKNLQLSVAVKAVQQAAKLTQSVRKKLVMGHSIEKDDRSPVTIADFGAQAIILHHLFQAFPEIPAVGEEDAKLLRENQELLDLLMSFIKDLEPSLTPELVCDLIDRGNHSGGGKESFWALDPIDGTKGFLRNDQYAIALALIEAGKPSLGVLGCPELPRLDNEETGCLFAAAVGIPPRQIFNDSEATTHPLKISETRNPAEAIFCESVESGHSSHSASSNIAQFLGTASEPVRMDSQCKYAAVARGQADLYLRLPTRKGYEEKIWDHAAGAFLVEASGGKVTDIYGKTLDFSLGRTLKNNSGVVASNGAFHSDVINAIGKTFSVGV
ncbi:MAG: 3'(2'),5'-bisphosphate nucleotidase [Verrucomicrobiota bacterium]